MICSYLLNVLHVVTLAWILCTIDHGTLREQNWCLKTHLVSENTPLQA